jgi:hypothetical protein
MLISFFRWYRTNRSLLSSYPKSNTIADIFFSDGTGQRELCYQAILNLILMLISFFRWYRTKRALLSSYPISDTNADIFFSDGTGQRELCYRAIVDTNTNADIFFQMVQDKESSAIKLS